ncbi:CPBP family intramembrane glutamic endopeptidase [Deinococcus koreensis]|uniref:CPBP family intramembrane metalloprotease n=1 Tax=Deinococcus koreensis TaxID=2054903 RepID=A0A2K3UXK7_9DEIO|nr:CPBP family intramembrane glutamic endopeptidase [Deinococcus koreensis]PNY81269.1 CPBP family intramembrane metalloprotease [Deinococcus koreensis]
MTTAAPPARSPRPWIGLLRLAVPGLIGVAALFPTARELVRGLLERPETAARIPANLPLDAVTALALIQPGLLTVGAVVLGGVLAPKVGLRSVLAGTARLSRSDLGLGVLSGVFSGAALVALDALTRPLLGEAGAALSLSQPRGLPETLVGVLYGGVTEELLLRWGVMTLLVWAGWRLFQRGQGAVRPGLMCGAILLSAVVFGLGHLGAAGSLVALTPAVILRTVGLNALVGTLFGWLYWRRTLETAMVAHASWHVTVTLIGLGLAALA